MKHMQFDNKSKCYRMDKIIIQYKALINFQCLSNSLIISSIYS